MELTEKDLQDIMQYLNEQPTKFALPLINFLNSKLNAKETPKVAKEPEGKPTDDKSKGGDDKKSK